MIESDLGVVPKPVDSAENPPDERSHSKCQGDSEGPVAEIGELVEKTANHQSD